MTGIVRVIDIQSDEREFASADLARAKQNLLGGRADKRFVNEESGYLISSRES